MGLGCDGGLAGQKIPAIALESQGQSRSKMVFNRGFGVESLLGQE